MSINVESLAGYLSTKKIPLARLDQSTDRAKDWHEVRVEFSVPDVDVEAAITELKSGNSPAIIALRQQLTQEGLIPAPNAAAQTVAEPDAQAIADAALQIAADAVAQVGPDPAAPQPGPEAAAQTDPNAATVDPNATTVDPNAAQPDPANPPPPKEGKGQGWGTIVLGAVGILAWIGALFTSDDSGKGKSIFAGIGGLLLGGALISQWPGIGKVFGKALDFVKVTAATAPDNAGAGGG